jgi:hypothetical protein
LPVSTDITLLMERARRLRLNQDQIARYSTVNVAVISRGRNYGVYIELADFRKIEHFIEAAEELVRRAGGAALDWKDSVSIDRLLKKLEEEKRNPPAPPTDLDWRLLGLVHSMTPVAIAKQLGIPLSELAQQFKDAQKRFDYATNKLAARNADIGRLADETVRLVDENQKARNERA